MPIYAVWNNKGGVGKSYLTFQIACEYARIHPNQSVLVLDLCPQANASGMFLGGMIEGEKNCVNSVPKIRLKLLPDISRTESEVLM